MTERICGTCSLCCKLPYVAAGPGSPRTICSMSPFWPFSDLARFRLESEMRTITDMGDLLTNQPFLASSPQIAATRLQRPKCFAYRPAQALTPPIFFMKRFRLLCGLLRAATNRSALDHLLTVFRSTPPPVVHRIMPANGVASYMLVSTQEKRHAFERELRCSIECWFKSKDLRASNKRFGRARANRKAARCPSGNQMRPIARFDGRNCQRGWYERSNGCFGLFLTGGNVLVVGITYWF